LRVFHRLLKNLISGSLKKRGDPCPC
jgi:hypothetical protein